jgi:glyoxylase-like metal-dependent hydrolase (beta-lactamase superfamily II)
MLGAKAVWHDLPGHDTAALVAHFRAHGLPETRAAQLEARGNTYRHGVPSLPVTYRRLLPDEVRTFGGRVWRCLAGYGHSPEHLALYCAEDALLIAGDMLLPKISTNVGVWASEPDGDPLAQFLASLDVLATLPDDTLILPSHGRPFRGAAARVAALKAHHAERLAAIEAACGSPMSAYDMVPVLFGRVFDLYQTFFALAESVAHLNHLWHRGRLARVAGRDGVWRFVRV